MREREGNKRISDARMMGERERETEREREREKVIREYLMLD